MRHFFYLSVLLSLAPQLALAQLPTKVLTTYYDSARTQRRTVYQVQLRGPRPDTVLQGPFRRFARTGSLAEIGHFADGKADSTWTRYYPAPAGQPGVVARRLPMRAGQPDGPFIVFHPNGRVAQRGTFRRGQLVDSLVTTSKTGSPRLLARFDSSRVPGLRGRFQHWGGRYTAQPLGMAWFDHQHDGLSGDNAYPRRDSGRYWVGQLAAGRLVGGYTEYDPDGEPRVRLSYTAQGQYRLTTFYYPAAWLRHEQSQYEPLPADSVVHSRPFFQWQAVGPRPYVLQRYWSFSYGSIADQSEDKVFKIVPLEIKWNQRVSNYRIRPRHAFTGDIIGALKGPGAPAALPPQVASAFIKPVADQSETVCSNLEMQYRKHGRPPLRTVAVADGSVLWRYPPLSSYRPPVSLQKLDHPGRWQLGTADSTGASLRPARRRVTALPDGRRLVETRHATRIYFATGKPESVRHRGLLHVTDHSYYPSGTRKEKTFAGLLGTFSQTWDEAGHSTRRDYESPLDMRRVRNYLKRVHPLRTLKRKLRHFQPMQPLYRGFRRLFPRHDHHTPRPHKG